MSEAALGEAPDVHLVAVSRRVALVFGFALLICLRIPGAWIHGRLWAEEGAKFYVRASAMAWWQALFAPWAGYLNLVANAAAILARHVVPLEYVPWITTFTGLIFQCCPAIILVCSRDSWLRRPFVLEAALLIIATGPMAEEVWLQSLHSQFHLALCCALILALDIPGWRLGLFGAAMLLLAPLCGPAACLLMPLFFLRALLDRSKWRAAQGTVLAFGAALQFLLFYTSRASTTPGVGPILLLCIVCLKQIVVPFLGRQAGQYASDVMRAQIAARVFPWQAVLTTTLCFAVFLAAILRQRLVAAFWFLASGCVITPVAYFFALVGGRLLLVNGNGERYAFVPQMAAALALLAVASGHLRPERWLARAAVVWLLIVGTIDVADPYPFMKEGPSWLAEVALWRQDHTHQIVLWPKEWHMTLSRE